MSLTYLLTKKGSPLHSFMNETFPLCLKLIKTIRTKVMEKPTVQSSGLNHLDSIIAGNAIDYRIRLFLENVTEGNLFIEHTKDGELYLAAAIIEKWSQSPIGSYGEQLLIDFYHWVKKCDTKKLLSKEEEMQLLRYIIVLSHFDLIHRSGKVSDFLEKPMLSSSKEDFVQNLFSQIEDDILEDLYELSSLFAKKCIRYFKGENYTLNPKFKGNRMVGGADADLIVDNTLIEIKSTMNPKRIIQKKMIQQLIGYVLLDLAGNQTATFSLHIVCTDSNGHEVYQTGNITMDIVELPVPEITLFSYSIDDSVYGNGDGVPDPGEIFLLYINVQVINTGFSVTGSANTTSHLVFYNASSYYGDLSDQISSGDGFIVEVPLNYPGGISLIDVTIFAESFSGRKVNVSGYLELTIDTGDIIAPTMSLLDTIPSQILQNDNLAFSVNIQDPSIANEITSGIAKVLLLWIFNEEDIQITEVIDQDSDGIYDFSLETSSLGTYYFIPVVIDNAGNIQYLADNDQAFVVEVFSVTTTPTMTSTTSITTTTTSEKTSVGTSILILFILFPLMLLSIVSRKDHELKE